MTIWLLKKKIPRSNMQYQLDSNGVATFAVKPMNDKVENRSRSIQIIYDYSIGQCYIYHNTTTTWSLRTSADIYYATNKKECDLVKNKRIDQFDFLTINLIFFYKVNSSTYECRLNENKKPNISN
ncbi:hypothetical protein [Neobacillus endophyticus]|uniref:hypothetical protein n=1 Tax=Neobacillus endophyticus TaxID=2738405 RepID=UPI001C27457B|nr:hypothetical protein [Neobacillus endophyticus]